MASNIAFAFGILGNIISALVYLSPIPTFVTISRNGNVGNFQPYPYLIALTSSMLWAYYGITTTLKNILLLINSFGCVVEIILIGLYIYHAQGARRINTIAILLLIVVGFTLFVVFTLVYCDREKQANIIGMFCVIFSVGVFAAPLGIMWEVFQTQSVEHMPFWPSLFLTLCAGVWLAFGLLAKQYYVAAPNTLGIVLGLMAMYLFVRYRGTNDGQSEPHPPVDVELGVDSSAAEEVQPPPSEAENVGVDTSEVQPPPPSEEVENVGEMEEVA